MTKPTILITGAGGATGGVAARLLLQQGFAVRAFVHREDERSRELAALGAQIVVGDLLDFRSVQRAFEGAARGYFVYPMRPGLAQATVHFAQAALDAGAQFIVNMSQKTARADARSHSALQHWLAERVFERSGIDVAHLRPTVFAEWALYMRNMIRAGRFAVPFDTEGRFAPVTTADQGAVIAALLADPAPHAGRTYELYGPQEMTAPRMAAIIGEVLGREIRYEKIAGEQWVKEVTGAEIPFLAQHIDEVGVAQAGGVMAGTNDLIETLTGHAPMSLAQFIAQRRAAFQ